MPSVLAIEDKPAVRPRAVDAMVEQTNGKFVVKEEVFDTKLEADKYRERMLAEAGLI